MDKKRSQSDEPTQETKPKKGKPAEIPIPRKRDVLRDLTKIARSKREDEQVSKDSE